MKMQGQKGKCKDDIKSYSLDRFEQVEQSKRCNQNHQNIPHCALAEAIQLQF
jgi:hypothetical protein